jgi:hypothetical protein
MCYKVFILVLINPRANGAERRSGRMPGARVLILPGYLHAPGATKALAKSKIHQYRPWAVVRKSVGKAISWQPPGE